MKHRTLARLCAVAALAACGLVNAATYVGRFDPPVYEGTASFDIPDACIPESGNGLVDVGTGSCDAVTFMGATVVNHPATNPPLGELTFDALDHNVAFRLLWQDGILLGIDSFQIGFAGPNGIFDNPGGYLLQFFTGQNVGFAALGNDGTQQLVGPYVELLACFEGCERTELVGGEPAHQEPFQRVGAVPEPGSLALLAGSLIAAGLARRRRR
jgi:hypothetical protein